MCLSYAEYILTDIHLYIQVHSTGFVFVPLVFYRNELKAVAHQQCLYMYFSFEFLLLSVRK